MHEYLIQNLVLSDTFFALLQCLVSDREIAGRSDICQIALKVSKYRFAALKKPKTKKTTVSLFSYYTYFKDFPPNLDRQIVNPTQIPDIGHYLVSGCRADLYYSCIPNDILIVVVFISQSTFVCIIVNKESF